MAHPLHVLIQMARHERDHIAQTMQHLAQQIDTVKGDIQEHEALWCAEMETMQVMGEWGMDFQGFYRRFQIQHDLLHAQLHQLERDWDQKTEALRDHFEQEKKYEHVEHEHQAFMRQKQEHLQTQMLDEWNQTSRHHKKSSKQDIPPSG